MPTSEFSDRPMATPALRRSLSTMDGVAIAASSTAVTTTIGVGLATTAAIVGLQLPILVVLAFLPIIGIAIGYASLNRVEASCGNSYVWVGHTLSPWLGFLSGWCQLLATLVFLSYTTAIAGSALIQLLGGLHVTTIAGLVLDANSTLQTTILGLVLLIPLTLTAIRGAVIAARLQKYLLIFEYAVLLGFCVYGLFVGHQRFAWNWFDPFAIPSWTVLAQGLVVAVFCYWGFEAAFAVTEEVRHPRDASRAGIMTVLLALGLFVLAAVSFQRVIPQDDLIASGSAGLEHFGEVLAAAPMASLPVLALAFSVIASVQATLIPSARFLLAMGRDRTLGPMWTRIHPRFGTPAQGTICVAVLSGAIALAALIIPKLSDLILAGVNSVGLVVALWYGLTGLAAAVRFRGTLRTDPLRALPAVVAPLLSGVVLFGLAGYLAWTWIDGTDHFAFTPDNGWFLLSVPAAMFLSGMVMAAVGKWVRKSPYFVSGRGSDAASLDLNPAGTAVEPGTTA
ncbi:APC family permease [Gordonia polyisoprenivorans]|uniref:APC family permease n=1 Tax=Gordonia polyisoprenivorans TaxID=84595 RepID=UPI000B99EEEA|nr:APC family permease [Gordonia polyisoprenivorans]MBE7196038.1 APC family permease [Gordonia polyisoprenivorans]OZC30884.1 amino acid transporter [Gordonia polyisoprenivorans]